MQARDAAYCRGCGRQMIPRTYPAGFDSETGEPALQQVLVCPRFDRSWRNLWFGGWGHYGLDRSTSQFGCIDLEVSWS